MYVVISEVSTAVKIQVQVFLIVTQWTYETLVSYHNTTGVTTRNILRVVYGCRPRWCLVLINFACGNIVSKRLQRMIFWHADSGPIGLRYIAVIRHCATLLNRYGVSRDLPGHFPSNITCCDFWQVAVTMTWTRMQYIGPHLLPYTKFGGSANGGGASGGASSYIPPPSTSLQLFLNFSC
jgi:hypothetical protein